MRIRLLISIIITGFVFIFVCYISAIAYIDAPHNESNNISCGSCHGQGLLNSPFWGGSGTYDQICLSCHTESSGPYTPTGAPLVKTHSSENTSDKYGNWTRECRNCHDPHYQRQKFYKMTDSGNLYLATGTITDCVYNGVDGTSTLTYSTITYKSGWDAGKLTEKTGQYRRTIMFPNVDKLGYSYPVVGVDTPTVGTITVKGDACTSLTPPTTYAVMYGQYVKDYVSVGGSSRRVKFLDHEGVGSFSDGGGVYDGICEVCHTQTEHYRNDGSGSDQHHMNVGNADGTNCVSCHSHTDGFAHGGGGGTGCDSCHGHSGSHYRHSDVDPPATACSDCHNTSSYPEFADNEDLTNTTVCNTCHSPNGAFDGVNDTVIGAKGNWEQGAYEGAYPGTLRSGKERWCAGCHDDVPSVVKGTTAPDIVGDNSTYGYYLDTHGNGSYGVSRKNVTYSRGECLHCHDVSQSGHGGQLFDTTDNFCFKCHDNTTNYATTNIVNRSYSYRAGGWTSDPLDDILEAFSLNSHHNLSDIKSLINGQWGFDADSNPCAACHNPHRVQGDPANAPDSAKSPSTRGYLVSRPSQHSTDYNNIWGDEQGEKMSDYTDTYQAPYREGSTSEYEPDGSDITDGSNLIDTVTFCLDCHKNKIEGITDPVCSYSYSTGACSPRDYIHPIDWDTPRNCPTSRFYHGRGDRRPSDDPDDARDEVRAPYNSTNPDTKNYVLSCLDCHEPHGSTNVFTIRQEVNGQSGVSLTSGSRSAWISLCSKCHTKDFSSHWTSYYCGGCHRHCPPWGWPGL